MAIFLSVFAGAIFLELVTGYTFAFDPFQWFGGGSGPSNSRLPILVRRGEQPEQFWVAVACQIVWFLIFLGLHFAFFK